MARRGGSTAKRQETLMDHVKELRVRGTIVALTLLVGACLGYVFIQQLFNVIEAPLQGQELISLTVGGSLAFMLNICVFVGFAVAIPVLIYHIYGFMRPLMPEKLRRKAVGIFFFSLFLMAGGVAFAYYMALPGALDFLTTISEGNLMTDQLTADAYLGFFIKYLIGLAILFQAPLILMLIHFVKPLTPKGLLKSERWVILLSFIAAALITPTQDPINLMIVAVPTIAVYQIGVFGIIFGIMHERRVAKKTKLRTQKRELAAVKQAVTTHTKVQQQAYVARKATLMQDVQRPVPAHRVPGTGTPRPVAAKATAVHAAPAPVQPAVHRPLPVKTIDFLPLTRKQAPVLEKPLRQEAATVPRPAERAAQTYRTRQTIDGFARRPSQPTAAPVQPQVNMNHPMQSAITRQAAPRPVDGISTVLAPSA